MSRNPDDSGGDARVPVARVLGPRGLLGVVKVIVEPGVFDQFGSVGSLTAEKEDGERILLEIEALDRHGSSAAIKFKGVDDRDAASKLRGAFLTVERGVLPPLGDNRYYRFELVGMEAIDPDGRVLGNVARIGEFPAHDVIIIDTGDSELWVPAVAEFIMNVDTANRRIMVARSDEFPPQSKES